jgi:UDP-GlcNAc:undecaprenyl-phosphate GlcNAc-1-phosphate transferase
VAIVMASGVVVERISLFGWDIELGLLAIPFTLFWLLGAINSLNLIDGMDGLLSSLGLIICLALAAMAVLTEHWAMAAVGVVLAGALLGFLRYNFPPASIFLGDSGSMLVGLIVGVLGIQSSLKGPATIALAAPLAIMTVPILDTGLAILRRKLTGRSIYTTDRGHLHHCLLRRGLSSRGVLLCVATLSFITVWGALASVAFHGEFLAVLSALAVAGILVMTKIFGHAELVLLKNRLATAAVSFLHVRHHGDAHQTETRLQGSADWGELWGMLTESASPLNLISVRLDVNAPSLHEGYHARWDRNGDEVDEISKWRAEIPLAVYGQTMGRLEVIGQRDDEPMGAKIFTVAKLVEDFESSLSRMTAHMNGGPHFGPNGKMNGIPELREFNLPES